mmetsp:Transcript_16633/g.29120  ORF Transcript_16633/g.29120 Transcript_16633/m.29120 type:complete len:150 (+) Transcript_16633:80-529(+)|eukprot:CAMPEP_0197647702 /NCGR_PEP_ID=MMETSP1338-20131121/26210_1 /TAXON_ID=43686 ORGANISM="Pelagodinium beii, Strain RCC1491" /NCGR_SAMPLE_ID=MMETSP1338 /ASSEMBLY_ACC=CAM_ASM_000754 /LENGTH=149 /DNA_ID=CAMNT_0043221557 /DNA_START=67 /DNA_END=516 /DNA_ORIENTATION=-
MAPQETFEDAMVRARKAALTVLRSNITELQAAEVMKTSDSAEVLRDVCEELNEMATELYGVWNRTHPGQPLPSMPVETIPAEELEKIGWDSHANRVRMHAYDTCVLSSILDIFNNSSRSYSKPPSPNQVYSALSAVESRLSDLEEACVE